MVDLLIPCATAKNKDVVVRSSEILYVALVYPNKTPKIAIHTSDHEYISKISGSLDSLEILLGQFGFVRVDSGCLVNVHHFDRFEKEGIDSHFFCFKNSEKKILCSRNGYTRAKKAIANTP